MSCLSHYFLQRFILPFLPSSLGSYLPKCGILYWLLPGTKQQVAQHSAHSRSPSTSDMRSYLHKLPPELLLLVLQHLNVLDLGALLCADYSLLRRWQIVDKMPWLEALTPDGRTEPFRNLPARRPGLSCTQGFPLPLELWLQMDPLFSYEDRLNLASALWPILAMRWNVGLRKG